MEKQDVSQVAKRIRSLMREKQYREVVKIAKGLNLNRINNGLLILDIVEAYEKLGDKKAAKMALLNYYDVHGITGRNMMQKLIELCIETRDIHNAVGLCMEFENEWPESSISHLMRYQITTSAGGSLDERIYYLEKYKKTEFEERWAYELAKLYDKNNQREQCAEICHEIICFFGTGKYVEKAVQLKGRTTGLTEDEINIIEAAKRREEEARARIEEEERLAREEMARLAEEEARKNREQEERRQQEAEYRRQQEELRQKEELRRQEEVRQRATAEEQAGYQQQEDDFGWTEEGYAARRARQAENEKIRQTEEAARLLREKKEADRLVREQKLSRTFNASDRYAQIEKSRSGEIYFDEIIRDQGTSGEKVKQKKNSSESNSFFSSFGRMASNVRKTLQPDEDYLEEDDSDAEVEYITVGRDTQAYVEDIEEKMLSELDMLDDDQIDKLTSAQIKEIYELKVLHDVRESIKDLIIDTNGRYHMETSRDELEKFVDRDPFTNPLKESEESVSEEEIPASEEKESTVPAEKEVPISEEKESTVSAEEEIPATEEKESKVSEEKEPMTVKGNLVTEGESLIPAEEEKTVPVQNESPMTAEDENPVSDERKNAVSEKEENAETAENETTMPAGEENIVSVEKENALPEKEENAAIDENESPKPEKEANAVADEEESPVSSAAEIEVEVKETILDRITDPDTDLTPKEFSECITAYAESKGYRVEETAYMTIAVLAEEMQQKETPLSLNNAKIMTDDAIARIQKRNPFDKIVDRYSKKHAYLLKDKHFYWKE